MFSRVIRDKASSADEGQRKYNDNSQGYSNMNDGLSHLTTPISDLNGRGSDSPFFKSPPLKIPKKNLAMDDLPITERI